MSSGGECEYVIPLKDQSVFGAGVRRKKINFVPSKGDEQHQVSASTAQGAGDRYLSIVLNRLDASSGTNVNNNQDSSNLHHRSTSICEICRLPIESKDAEAEIQSPKPHETSLAHQLCLEHSHPPSHLDRTRQGLRYLSSYGWDPDARLGLGATGRGIRIPVKTKPKNDTLGLGLIVAPSFTMNRVAKPAVKKLDAKKTRKAEESAKREREKLRNIFYEREDVERHLGSSR
ncbi:MAG: hypothetical protein L6R38_002030 [Xanthoria sp. 2 TBL-2021]|nr:MAG: hypothetical protein L6R38_002030 [Xanthoria sp. 2 TBL-2021]